LISVHLICVSQQSAHGEICDTLHLINLSPFPRKDSGWDKGFELIPAGHLATKHINSDPDILSGYNLKVIDVPSEACGINLITEGIEQYFRQSVGRDSACILGVVGLFCSTVTNFVAPIASHPKLGYVQMAASTSPLHRNTDSFPYTFHTIASSRIFNQAMVALMRRFSWNQVNVVFGSVGFYFRTTALDFFDLVKNNSSLSVTQIPVDSSISDLFKMINREESRIGYFTVTNEETAQILCEAYRLNFLSRYQFIFHERTISEVLKASNNTNCTEGNIVKALESIFLLQYKLKSSNNTVLVSNRSYSEYNKEYEHDLTRFAEETNMSLEFNNYANALYDEVWGLALAANKSLEDVSFLDTTLTPSSVSKIREVLKQNLLDVKFNGASGYIEFGMEQEVQTSVNVFQVINGVEILIGEYNAFQDNLTFEEDFNGREVPGDSFDDVRYDLLPLWLGLVVILCSAVLILLTLFNIIAMYVLRRSPEIKSTSLYLSMVILIGCFLLLLSPILLTIKSVFPITNTTVHVALCSLEFWFYVDGIMIIFLTLLLRLLRIFHVFRSHHSTSKYWSDKYLILYISLMFSFMVILLIIQSAKDPFQSRSRETFVTISTELPFKLVFNYCSNGTSEVWLILSFSLVALVMVLVTFLAIQTRHIKRQHFKDTKKVNMFIFSVCLFYTLFISLWLILRPRTNTGAYVCKCIANLMVATLCQAFLFFPKVIPAIYSRKQVNTDRKRIGHGLVTSTSFFFKNHITSAGSIKQSV
jgi:cytochrome bd-type quinol oxidase subunit 2